MADDMAQDRRTRIGRAFVGGIPHARALNLSLVEIGPGRAVIEMPFDAALVGDPEAGVIHGGAVFTLMDTSAGAAVMAHDSAPDGTATLDLRIDYMRSARPGQALRAVAECYHVTRSVAFVRVETRDGDDARPVAVATGAFTLMGGAGS